MEGQQEVNNNVKHKVGVEDVEDGGRKERRIVVKGPEEWLCVARLPPDMEEEEFLELLQEFGRVEEAFLVLSLKTGWWSARQHESLL